MPNEYYYVISLPLASAEGWLEVARCYDWQSVGELVGSLCKNNGGSIATIKVEIRLA